MQSVFLVGHMKSWCWASESTGGGWIQLWFLSKYVRLKTWDETWNLAGGVINNSIIWPQSQLAEATIKGYAPCNTSSESRRVWTSRDWNPSKLTSSASIQLLILHDLLGAQSIQVKISFISRGGTHNQICHWFSQSECKDCHDAGNQAASRLYLFSDGVLRWKLLSAAKSEIITIQQKSDSRL